MMILDYEDRTRLGSKAEAGELYIGETPLKQFPGDAYECRALLVPEPEGGFSIFATRLPGVVSQGETEEEAIANIAEAFQGAILAYREHGMEIPWTDRSRELGCSGKELWILVNV